MELASLWANCISLDRSTSQRLRFDVARILVSTEVIGHISTTVLILVDGHTVDISVFEESSGETIFSRGMDRMRMPEVDELRASSGDSDIHSCCHKRVSPVPGNLRLDSLSADLPSTGTKGFRVLTKERVNDDGLAGVYTSNSIVSRKGLIDCEAVADMGCINEFANVAGSHSKSNSRAKGHKLSPSMRVIWAAEGSHRERGLGVDHPCRQTGELGLLHGPNAPRVGPGPVTCSAEFSQCTSRPAGDKVSTSQKPESLSSSSVHISGPSKAVKGRPRLSVILMGRFKIGVKKKSKKQRKDRVSRSTEEVGISIDDSGIRNMNRINLQSQQENTAQNVWAKGKLLGLKAVGDEGEVLQKIRDMDRRDHLAMVNANSVGKQGVRHVVEVSDL
ncbi:hypothetical protein Ancab_022913 [Ancistrocladus abbreviatus]